MRISAGMVVAERQRPQIGNGDGASIAIRELAEKSSVHRIEGVDVAVAIVGDKQSAAERTEIRRRQRQSPGRIERPIGCKAAHQIAVRVVDVDETESRAGNTIATIPLGVCNEEPVVDVLDVEWCKTGREIWILKSPGSLHGPEGLVEDSDGVVAEIGGKEEAVRGGIGRQGESRVVSPGDGIIKRQQSAARIDDGTPAENSAVLIREQETAGRHNAVLR